MQFSKIVVAALLGVASAAPRAVKRSASTIETDISTISSELTTLNTAIAAYTGTITQSLKMLVIFDDLADDITSATSAIKSTGTLGTSDSATIYSDVEALSTKFETVMEEVESQASVFVNAGYSSYASEYLTTLETDTASFYSALETYIASTYTSEVKTLASAVATAFSDAIADF